jgi:hypothetical protein
MKAKVSLFLVLLTLGLIQFDHVQSQSSLKLLPESSSIKIKGTSNIHDWEEAVKSFTCELKINKSADDILSIEFARLICDGKSISSGKSLMDSKAKDAIKADKFPKIQFILVSIDDFTEKGELIAGNANGILTLAGISRNVTISFTGHIKTGLIQILGSKALQLHDFDIVPPTALFGTLQTGKEVTIDFNLAFAK